MVSQSNSEQFPFDRFSCFNRMQRVTAFMLRFIHNSRTKITTERNSGPLTVEEINKASTVLTRIVQQQSFPDIYFSLKTNKSNSIPKCISGLNIFMDENSIIRVGGRLKNSVQFLIKNILFYYVPSIYLLVFYFHFNINFYYTLDPSCYCTRSGKRGGHCGVAI